MDSWTKLSRRAKKGRDSHKINAEMRHCTFMRAAFTLE
jgi:hypothetical protein